MNAHASTYDTAPLPSSPQVSYEGPRWCFNGPHTTRPLPSSDQRRVDKSSVTLVAGPKLQEQIDALPDDVRDAQPLHCVLSLCATAGSGGGGGWAKAAGARRAA